MSLSSDIKYWSITLKSYCASWVTSQAKKEEYGIDTCDCLWISLILATSIIDILDCYDYTDDICLTETDIRKIFQTASKIINKGCGSDPKQ